MTRKKLSFEEALEALNRKVKELEQGDLSLEDSLKHYEESMELLEICRSYLNGAEARITALDSRGQEVPLEREGE